MRAAGARARRSGLAWPGLRAFRRDWRSGELRLLLLALVVAVAAVASVGFLADRVAAALEGNSAQMLGADLVLRADEPLPPEFGEQARSLGLAVSRGMRLSSMASAQGGMRLVSLKAVDAAYPLRGELRLAAPGGAAGPAVSGGPAPGTVWVDPQLTSLLGVREGDVIQLGESSLRVAGIIAFEPDKGVQFINIAPRVMMRLDDLPATGLTGPASRLRYDMRVAGGPRAVAAFRSWLEPRLDRGQQLALPGQARPEIQRSLTRAHQFLVLVALLTVVVAAVAAALAARRFNRRHQAGFAVMRCLGASQAQLGAMLLVEFLMVALLSALAGTLIGYAVQEGLAHLASAWLDKTLPAPSWRPAWHGAATALLLLAGFAVPPLLVLRRSAPLRVLRRDMALADPRGWLAWLPGVAAFFALAWWVSGDLTLSAVVCGGFLLGLGLFWLAAYLCVWAVGRTGQRLRGWPNLRLATTGMARRKGLTTAQVCALSSGLMVLLLLALTRTDLLAGWRDTLPADAPNTFLINIQPEQRDAVASALREAGIRAPAPSPMVRGRLLSINGRQVDADNYQDDRARRLADREFNLSYMDALPSSNSIVAGRWLDAGRDEVSIETGLAETLGIGMGDTLTFDVAGEPVDVRVTSLREVKWDSFEVNFFAVLTPRALRDAPATFITSFHLPPGDASLMPRLVTAFPNLTVFDVGAILGQVRGIIGQAIGAVQLLFLFTVAAGVLVLGAALVSTRDERIHEAAILRVLGARAGQLRSALYAELVLVGVLSGLLACAGAVAVAWTLAVQVFEFPLSLSWWPWAAGVGAGVAAACAGGGLALRGVLRAAPLASLREAA